MAPQPNASHLAAIGSIVVIESTGPSTWELLASSRTVSRDSPWCAANIAASQTWPSSSSPSLTIANVRRSARLSRSDSAKPAAALSPWPSEPQT